MLIDYTAGGWTPKTGKIKKMRETVKKLKLTKQDTIVIDPMSNSAFLWTAPSPRRNPTRMGGITCLVTSS
jgi:hypothetical protein